MFARWCRNSAIEDFQFAIDLLDTQRTEQNETELYALATVTAMRLYRLTQDVYYLDWATRLARTVMGGPTVGKAYRLENPPCEVSSMNLPGKSVFWPIITKARALDGRGLSMLLTDAPTHPDAPLWQSSCEAYADYLRGVSQLIEPYAYCQAPYTRWIIPIIRICTMKASR